ncbi:MAG: S1C family serine protease [Akkermansiaceae bacterium]
MTQHIFLTALSASFIALGAQIASCAPDIKTLEDLKAIQEKATQTVKKVLPATVSLFSAKNGASGSGVIVNKDGLILTAGHVVRGADEVTVVFPNGKQARGKVLGANYTRDSAMVQIIDKGPWPSVELGHSKNLKPGDLVIALGHAGGYDPVRTPPVRFGRIIARSINKFISSDCTLIGGDSGGPLFDMDGKVIGIHSSIGESLASNNHAGLEGFREDWDRLKKGETWGRLGGSALDDPNAPVLGVMTEAFSRGGVAVSHVFEGGPADKAGIRQGDIIRSINGRRTMDLRRLHAALTKFKPGNIVSVRITRGDNVITRKVKLGRRGDVLK